MRGRLLRHPALPLVTGAVLVGAGLLLTRVPPRADAPDIPPSAVAGAPTPAATPRATPVAGPAAPTAVSLPGTPPPVPVVPVGVRPSRALELSDRPSVLGWYATGAVSGDPRGTAVVAGHVDSAEFGAGSLRGLLHVKVGDPVEVTDAVGGTHRYAGPRGGPTGRRTCPRSCSARTGRPGWRWSPAAGPSTSGPASTPPTSWCSPHRLRSAARPAAGAELVVDGAPARRSRL